MKTPQYTGFSLVRFPGEIFNNQPLPLVQTVN